MTAPSADVAYYYPAPYWAAAEGGWVKSLLLFFDRVAILLPGYMYGVQRSADPTLAGPLEDRGLLDVIEPNTWVDQTVTEQLAAVVVDLLVAGAFDDLDTSPDRPFHELSYSRMGYGADVELADMLIEELTARGLARPSSDGVSVPLQPVVRLTILVVLGQLARAAGAARGLSVHPATGDGSAARDLVMALSRARMPSAGHVVALDLEAVTLDLSDVPLDDVLEFRAAHLAEHKAYMQNLRGFLAEVASTPQPDREQLLVDRRAELADAAHDLRSAALRGFRKNVASWSLGIAGAVWSYKADDALGVALAAAGLLVGAVPDSPAPAAAYSYLFQAARSL